MNDSKRLKILALRFFNQEESCFELSWNKMLPPDGYPMMETTWDASGWLYFRKHTRFVHGVFHDL